MNGRVKVEDMRSSQITRVATVLRDQGMPADELHEVLTTSDHELVRRYLELHLERLDEWLTAQRRRVTDIERILATLPEEVPEVGGSSGRGVAASREAHCAT
jgi:hypothetical protein